MMSSCTKKFLRQLVFYLFWTYTLDLCQSQEQFAGPYRVVVRQIDKCDESGIRQFYFSSTRINKVSRSKYFYSTNVTTETVINDDLAVELDIANFGNGGWKPHFMTLEFDQLCTSMKQTMPVLYKAIVKSVRSDCPFQPGTYEVKDVDMDDLKVGPIMPNFPYGKYRADFYVKKNNVTIGCSRTYADVVPAKRTRPQKKQKTNSI
ncbi:uncharacterized protein [Halyomorpha halys]|uniref:uncharacterized protein n=1 Tax=Halyomorpha halys TaxID=286706 RepID=UPI0006D4CEFE|nr:uncharacterized protein LOC106687434 [Halyomorpha halys]